MASSRLFELQAYGISNNKVTGDLEPATARGGDLESVNLLFEFHALRVSNNGVTGDLKPTSTGGGDLELATSKLFELQVLESRMAGDLESTPVQKTQNRLFLSYLTSKILGYRTLVCH